MLVEMVLVDASVCLDKEAFEKQMLEKLVWICSVMLVEKEFRSEVSFSIAIFSKLICQFCQSPLQVGGNE
jgi:hypothetical protein